MLGRTSHSDGFALIAVGGGLQAGLLALAMAHHRPESRVALVEARSRLGGNHRWSFHEDDLPSDMASWVRPLVQTRWGAYDVRFPGLQRTLESNYASFEGSRLHDVVTDVARGNPNLSVLLGAEAVHVDGDSVVLADGRVLRAPLVVDARGPGRLPVESPCAYQKFVGVEVSVSGPAVPTRPTIMDAAVEQVDGFRFVYVLPLSPGRLLIEDTYFSDEPHLPIDAIEQRIGAYAEARGWRIEATHRKETGVLPLPRRYVIPAEPRSPFVAGYAGGWFHPTTGYSFPCAVRLADHLAREGDAALESMHAMRRAHRRQLRFAVHLNRLLYGAFAPGDRHKVLERFYTLPEPTIRRFYAMQTTLADRGRIVCGRPPAGFSLRLAFDGAV